MSPLVVLVAAVVVCALVLVRRARWSLSAQELVRDLDRRVARVESDEQVLIRVVIRTYDPDRLHPLASPFTVPPIDELVVMTIPLAMLATMFRYCGEDEMSLLGPMPGIDHPVALSGDGPGRFFDVVLTRADRG